MAITEIIGMLIGYAKNPAIFTVGFSILTLAAILIVVMKKVVPVMPYLYANSRIQARSGGLIDKRKFGELASSKRLSDMTSYLQDTDYASELANVVDLRGFQTAVETSFRKSIEELKGMSPRQIHPIFDSYLEFWEAKVIKTIYRKLFVKRDPKEALKNKLVFPVGNISETQLNKMLESESLSDLSVSLTSTPYSEIFEESYKNLLEFEVAMDKFILDRFKIATRKASKAYDAKLIIELLNRKFDILNIMFLLKANERELEADVKRDLLIKTDTELSNRLDRMLDIKELELIIEELKGLPYYTPMKEAFDSKKDKSNMLKYEINLQKDYYRFVKESELMHSQGPYPLFAYLVKKEIELKNLMIISKGISAKFPQKEIEEMLI